jgi:hypothetical protein
MPDFGKMVRRAAEAAAEGIRAWHASPHQFEKFDIGKVGTGQGAASYGKGIYAAEHPAVSGPGGEYWQEFARRTPIGSPQYFAQETLRAADFNRQLAIKEANELVRLNEGDLTHRGTRPQDIQYIKQQIENRKLAAEILADPTAQAGPSVYELNIRAPREDFLNWDRPLAGQLATQRLPALVDAAKREAYDRALAASHQDRADQLWNIVKQPEQASGELAYHGLLGNTRGTYRLDARDAAMNQMRDAGIPGIEYLDQNSRQITRQLKDAEDAVANIARQGRAGTPEHQTWSERVAELKQLPSTSNFVLHRDDIIDILKRYGIAAPVATGAIAGQMQQPQGQ